MAAQLAQAVGEHGLEAAMADCLDPAGMYEAYASHAAELEAWHAGDRRRERPPGRLRVLSMPHLTGRQRAWAAVPLDLVHDPDGRPKALRKADRY